MQLDKLNVVAIGGGHGLGRVLSALSFLGDRLTGIVTTTDNGGSTGRLRQRSSSIAWGDLRNCLTQLVDSNAVGAQLFNFRFDGADELGGHNLGNLILYGLGQIQSSPLDSIDLIRKLLGVKTLLLPMSAEPTDLLAFYPQGRCRVGELSVDEMPVAPQNLLLAPLVKAPTQAIEAIEKADLIILGPGSFLTSVVPPLLVRDISKALKNRRGQCVYIENLVDENSPAAHMSLDDKIEWIKENIGCQPIDFVLAQDKNKSSSLVDVYYHDLAQDELKRLHSSEKLINALDSLMATQQDIAS